MSLICCCCCTHAELTGRAFRDLKSSGDHQIVFYGDSLTTDVNHLLPNINEPVPVRSDNIAYGHESQGKNGKHFRESYVEIETDSIHPITKMDDHDHDHNHGSWTTAQQWGYATLANSVVVSFSLCGIVIVKCTNSKNRRTIGDFFLGLVVSIMLGDAIMHIMPHFLGKRTSLSIVLYKL